MPKNKKRVFTGIIAAYSILTSALFPVDALASTNTPVPASVFTHSPASPVESLLASMPAAIANPLSKEYHSTMLAADSMKRLAGKDRYETAAKISQEGWKATSDYAVLSAGMDENLVDALTVVPLAKAKNAPILLTEGNALNAFARAELLRLKAKTVYITSGSRVITPQVLEEVRRMGIEVKELGGSDRFETAINIAKALGVKDRLIVATAFTNADALSIGSIAAAKGIPILLSAPNYIPESVAQYLNSIRNNISQTYVLGNEGALSKNVNDALPHPIRLGGKNRFETNLEILKAFAGDLNYGKPYVASGEDAHIVDAITGSPLAAQTFSPVILASHDLADSTKQFALSALSPNAVAFGGEGAIPEGTLNQIAAAKEYTDDTVTLGSSDSTTPLTLDQRIRVTGNKVTISNANTPYSIYVQGNELNLKNLNIQGTLFIDAGDTGTANLENVKAGSIVVLSSADKQTAGKARIMEQGKAGIHLKNVQSISLVINGQSDVDTSGLTNIINAVLRSTSTFNVVDGIVGQVQIGDGLTNTTPTIELKGKLTSVVVTGQVNVVSTSADINKLLVQPDRQDAQITLQGSFTTLEIQRPGHVQLGANTTVSNTVVNASATLDATNGSFGKVEVAKTPVTQSEAVVVFKGTFKDTIVISGQVTIKKDADSSLTKIEVLITSKDQKVTFEGTFKPTEVIEVKQPDNGSPTDKVAIIVPEGSSLGSLIDQTGSSTVVGGGMVNGQETSKENPTTPPPSNTVPGGGAGGNNTNDITPPTVQSASATIGGLTVQALKDGNGWKVDLSKQPDDAMFTDMIITADQDATEAEMTIVTEGGTRVTKNITFTNGVANVNIHSLLDPFDSGKPGLAIGSLRGLGLTTFTAVIKDAAGNTSNVDIRLLLTSEDVIAPQVHSAKAVIDGQDVLAQGQGDNWTVDLSNQPDAAMFTEMTITADPDTVEATMDYQLAGGANVTYRVQPFTNGVATVNISNLLGDLDAGHNGVSIAKLRELGISTFTATIKDASNNQRTIYIRVKTTVNDTTAPVVQAASAQVGVNTIHAVEAQNGTWTVDLSKEPDTALFTNIMIEADPDTASATMSLTTNDGLSITKDIQFTHGIANVSIHNLLGTLDQGDPGLMVSTLREMGISSFTAKMSDTSNNTSTVTINVILS